MNPDDQRARQSRVAIIEAGVRTLLRNPEASLTEIAREAGVGRATLYRHFETRDALVQALALACLEETDLALAQIDPGLGPLQRIYAAVTGMMPLADRYRFLTNLWDFAESTPEADALYASQLERLTELVEAAKQAGEIDTNIDTAWITAAFDGLLNAAWWMVETGQLTPEAAGELMTRTLDSGVRAQ